MRLEALLLLAVASSASADEYVVAQGQSGESDENPGTAERPFLTISAVTRVAGADDVVTIHDGVYRESVILVRGGEPGRPVVYEAAPGADEATDWQRFTIPHIDTRRNLWVRAAQQFSS